MLDLKLLQSFREVAVRRSFSAAAEALSFTQPAVSQHVARLEKALDAPLLVRDSRGVTLTPAGDALLAHAEEILAGVRRAETQVRERGAVGGGRGAEGDGAGGGGHGRSLGSDGDHVQ